ncbi:MAG: Do family serine endopeptidase [Pseudomonadota bacterium]|nr:Do family serine endopeptidase [Pseudomonadota bacterium]
MTVRLFGKLLLLSMLLAPAPVLHAQALPDFTALVEQNAPAIVKVGTTREREELDAESRERVEQMLRYFYGDRVPEDIPLPEPDGPEAGATGSGFIIDSTGYIVTNHHVVEDADGITVTLYDQRELEAEVIGTDELSDLALLKVNANNLPTVRLGNSSDLKIGEWVLAMGSPFGLQYSVTAGIISYMGRALPTGSASYVSYIQTDVAINPGHSGGPLFNLAGEVIGINSQIFTNSGGSIGLSFAIPVDVAKNVVSQLQATGTVTRGYVGIGYENVSQALAEAFNLDTPHGALVNQVMPGEAGARAGIQIGDIIVAINGNQVRTGPDLPYFIGLLLPGTTVDVELVRNGEPLVLQMTLGSRSTTAISATETPEEEDSRTGLIVSAIDAEIRNELGIEHGVLVEEATGAAAAAGLQPGDVVIALNNVELDTPEDLVVLEPTLPADRVLPVLVSRGNRQSFFTIELDD